MIAEGLEKFAEIVRQANNREQLTHLIDATYDGADASYEYAIDATANGPALGKVIQPFRPAKLLVSTLTGFIDAVNAGIAGPADKVKDNRIIHVEDYLTVSLKTALCDSYGQRDTLLTAKYTPPGIFVFDQYQQSETFLIGLETSFLRIDGDDRNYVKLLVSTLKAGDTVHAQDAGVNQVVTLKIGQIETAEHAVKARVKLTPIRTFDESAPVESEFLIRFKAAPGGGLPLVALFNLNGTRWQCQCMASIKRYLGEHLPEGLAILA